jgi:hypothetical protein
MSLVGARKRARRGGLYDYDYEAFKKWGVVANGSGNREPMVLNL